MTDKKVSVIVPVYNAEKYLNTCIESLVSQTYRNIEVILVNDCSTDSSLEICLEWEKRDNRVHVFSLHQNSGPSIARNKGLENASGEYITFADADDWMDKECIENAWKVTTEYNADIVLWNFDSRCGDSIISECILEGNERVFAGDEIRLLCKLLLSMKAENGCYAIGLRTPFCKFFRAEILNGVLFPAEINNGEDACFNIQAFNCASKVVYINRVYYHRLFLDESLSNKMDFDYADRVLLCTNWVLRYCKKENIVSDEEINTFIYTQLKMVIVHYTKNAFPYRKVAKNKINYFIDNLDSTINWDMITEESKLKVAFLQKKQYWIYKVGFAFSRLKK